VPECKVKARFVEPMLLLRQERLPEGPGWVYEIKLDGYRALAIKSDGKLALRSRNGNEFNSRYPAIAKALQALPDETVVDGEVVALDGEGRPSFNLLQNYISFKALLIYYVFDVITLDVCDLKGEPLTRRRTLLEQHILPRLSEPIRLSPQFRASVTDLISSVKAQGLEGLVAKRADSKYEPGRRSGAWQKIRVNRGQEFVIGGYTVGGDTFDALIFGYYDEGRLLYVGRTRNGFTPSLRSGLMKSFSGLGASECPFTNLPESKGGRWGQGLTVEKMKDCRWLRPALVGQFEFAEWTPDNHLRHSRFIALRDDKKPQDVQRE
jgi:bifunctional non-homologous end joining protein LigD